MSGLPSDPGGWLREQNPGALRRLGRVRQAVFDFDGTLSVLRQGWEPVMEQVMLRSIYPNSSAPESVVEEVRRYIDLSTGQLTIVQMEWLAEAARRYGQVPAPLNARQYKAQYLTALMGSVSERLERLEGGSAAPREFLIAGSAELLAELARRGVRLYVASGSDHPDVVREAAALGIAPFLSGIYGALDASEANDKGRIIQRILDEHALAGDELLVVGDGPVEIVEGRARGAITLGLASDEVARQGWNQHKAARLIRAGADLLAADFRQAETLAALLAKP